MEKKFSEKLIKLITGVLIAVTILLLVSCDDDAILAPQAEDDCPGGPSYCNLSLQGSNDYAAQLKKNPTIF